MCNLCKLCEVGVVLFFFLKCTNVYIPLLWNAVQSNVFVTCFFACPVVVQTCFPKSLFVCW